MYVCKIDHNKTDSIFVGSVLYVFFTLQKSSKRPRRSEHNRKNMIVVMVSIRPSVRLTISNIIQNMCVCVCLQRLISHREMCKCVWGIVAVNGIGIWKKQKCIKKHSMRYIYYYLYHKQERYSHITKKRVGMYCVSELSPGLYRNSVSFRCTV